LYKIVINRAKARERGKKIQILELELREIRETLLVSKYIFINNIYLVVPSVFDAQLLSKKFYSVYIKINLSLNQ
jgi:hypothetical protein